ncbi:MAG: hypothetical protein ACLU5J_09685 [Christensenellales bacterium]
MNNLTQIIKKYGIAIQNIEKIPNEKLPDVIIDALLKILKMIGTMVIQHQLKNKLSKIKLI